MCASLVVNALACKHTHQCQTPACVHRCIRAACAPAALEEALEVSSALTVTPDWLFTLLLPLPFEDAFGGAVGAAAAAIRAFSAAADYSMMHVHVQSVSITACHNIVHVLLYHSMKVLKNTSTYAYCGSEVLALRLSHCPHACMLTDSTIVCQCVCIPNIQII